jgi:hypothetical protein
MAVADVLDRVHPMAAGQRKNAEETYLEVENLIRKEVWRITKKFGGDYDELLAEANVIFMAAWDSYDLNCGTQFTTWLVNQIRWGLTEQVRNRIRAGKRFSRVDAEQLSGGYRNWKPSDLLDELGEDARLVASLVIDTPADIAWIYERKGGQARNLRSTIRDYLADLGWSTMRIAESFREVARALTG